MDDQDATMQFYDASGDRVDADDPKAVVQYLSNDPARPDASAAADKAAAKASKAKARPDENKAVAAPDATK